MSWICPWCGYEMETELPEGRQTTECWHCHKTVPSKENFRRYRDKEIKRLETEMWPHEREIERLNWEIAELKTASFDRPKVRVIAKDQTTLPFEGVPA